MPLKGRIISNYSVLHELWDWSLDSCTVIEMKAQLCGVHVHTDSLSVCLQRKSLSAAEGQALAAMTIRTLNNMRADDKFALFWKDVTTLAEHNLVNTPGLPRRRHLPARYEDGDAGLQIQTRLLWSHWQVDNFYNRLLWPAWLLGPRRFTNVFDESKINRIRIFAMLWTEYNDSLVRTKYPIHAAQ